MRKTDITQGEMYRAGLPSPGARLLKATNMVRQDSIVADIGCDHGKLAVYLVLSGVAKKVIAADVRPLPLSKAKALVKQTGCSDKIECRLGDGLAVLHENEVSDIVIAGMSGETMAQILERAPWVQNEKLNFVFVPATHAEKLREWLYASGFVLVREEPVQENGRVYSVMQAKYTGEKQENLPQFFYEFGFLPQSESPEAKKYILHHLHHLQNMRKGNLAEKERQELEELIQEVERCLQ